jgi:putative flippase GtrA
MLIIEAVDQNLNKYPFVKQFIKFCLVGGLAAVIHFSVMSLLKEFFGVWYVLATLTGGILSAIFNFSANKLWTFADSAGGKKAVRQGLKFSLVIISGVLVNALIVFLLTDFGRLDYRWSWVMATGIVTFWNFTFNRLWTFRAKSLDQTRRPVEGEIS